MSVARTVAGLLSRLLLRLYPTDFRRQVGAQLVDDHRRRATAIMSDRGLILWAIWLVRALFSMVANAPMAWREGGMRREAPTTPEFRTMTRAGPVAASLDLLACDIRYSVRQLLGAPVLTMVASVSLAAGIFVAAGGFSFLNAILFKPLPVLQPEEVYHIYTSSITGRHDRYRASSYRDYLDFAASGAFEGLAAVSRGMAVDLVAEGGTPEEGWVGFISPNFFEVLRLALWRGRVPLAQENAIVLTYRHWQHEFGGDPAALGKLVRANGQDFVVVGVAPEGFSGVAFGAPIAGWVPAHALPQVAGAPAALEDRDANLFNVVGRRPMNGSPELAAVRLNATAQSLAAADQASWEDLRGERRLVSVLSDKKSRAPDGASDELVLIAGASTTLIVLLLLVICANVASLLLGRTIARGREIAVRIALGATRGRLLVQTLTESFALALLGSALGVGALIVGAELAEKVLVLRQFDLAPDWRVVSVILMLAVGCALVFGAAPALHSIRSDVRAGLATSSSSVGGNRLRGVLIASEVAVSCMLILASISTARAIRMQEGLDGGVGMDGILLSRNFYFQSSTPQEWEARPREIEELIASNREVRGVARTLLSPFGGTRAGYSVILPNGTEADVDRNAVSTRFFATLGVRQLAGRVFTAADDSSAARVVVVNRAFRESLPDVGVGSYLRIRDESWEVVGVVEDVQYHGSGEPIAPIVYQHEPQASRSSFLALVVAVPRGREQLIAAELSRQIQQRFPDMVPPRLEPLRDLVSEQLWAQRLTSRIALAVGAVELALATAGLYGLLLFVLSARMREIGVRLSLGAAPLEATWAVLRNGLRYMILGGVVGLLLGVPLVKLAAVLLYDGTAIPGPLATGPAPFLGAVAALLVAGGVASLIPAVRATQVQPATVLRDE